MIEQLDLLECLTARLDKGISVEVFLNKSVWAGDLWDWHLTWNSLEMEVCN